MKRFLPFAIVLAGIVLAGLIVVNRTDAGAPTPDAPVQGLVLKTDLVGQAADERTWGGPGLTPIDFPATVRDSLLNVISFRIYDGDLYLSDFGDMRVKRVGGDGTFLGAIGAGRGQGPGEAIGIMDVAVLNDTLWVADGQGRVLSSFTTDGAFIGRYPVSFFPMRVVAAGDHLYVLGMGGEGLLQEVDREGNVLRGFGDLFEDQAASELSLSNAMLAPTPDGGFAYLPLHGSVLFLFDEDGGLQRTLQTIDKRPVPASTSTASGGQRAADGDLKQKNVSFDDETIYIHTTYTVDDGAGAITSGLPVSVIDRYDYASGEYLDSFQLPQATYDAIVDAGRLYAVTDTSFVGYRLTP